MNTEHRWQEKKTELLGGKTYPSATLSTTNPIWTGIDLGRLNLSHRPFLRALAKCGMVLNSKTSRPAYCIFISLILQGSITTMITTSQTDMG